MPTYTGTAGSDSISGSGSADTITGLAGNDTLYDRGGDDSIIVDLNNSGISATQAYHVYGG